MRIAALPDEAWQLLFPMRHWDIVSAEAAKNQLDPSLIMGLIRQESAFNEKARSSADARGLMQLLPTTASKCGTPGPDSALSRRKTLPG